MVPLDGSQLAECVLPHVEAIAQGCRAGKVTLVRVVTPLHLYGGVESRLSPEERHRLESHSLDMARDYLERLAGGLKGRGVTAEAAVLFGADVAEELVNYAERTQVDLVIIATHGRSGVTRWVWGSMADRILRAMSTPVLMVRAPGHPAPGS